MTNKKNEVVTVNEGATYKNKATDDEVVAFHIERGMVWYAPVGRGTEFKMEIEAFLDQFELIKQKGE